MTPAAYYLFLKLLNAKHFLEIVAACGAILGYTVKHGNSLYVASSYKISMIYSHSCSQYKLHVIRHVI
jgi:uncharacterized membrane protein